MEPQLPLRDGDLSANPNSSGRIDDNEHGRAIDSFFAETEVNLNDKKIGFAIFDPPEAEDTDDDLEGSVSYIEDDDDGTVWGQPSSLGSFKREDSGSFKPREGKQRAMEKVVNGKLKTIVHELVRTSGITSSGEDIEKWTDIIASLSLNAACFVKPDPADSKAMDLDGYVKVKCVATGSRNQSQLIKGLVFKKNASHKHMPTKHNNPKLLLIHGALDQSSKLSSFDSMKQEESRIKSVVEKLAEYRPNLVLVEKSAARSVQELLLAKGMTLISDMKLHRLQQIARCTGSPIVTPDDAQNQILKHCESFHIEKFVEEHAVVGDGGKKPSKTLMFLEGLPTRFGCTIMLKGASNDELKRIKSVVKYAVVMTYHLILETAFRVDQRVMFSSVLFLNESPATNMSVTYKDIPITAGFDEGTPQSVSLDFKQDTTFVFEPYNPAIRNGLSYISDSVGKVVDNRYSLAPNFECTKTEEDSEIPITNLEISPQNTLAKGNGVEMPGSISEGLEISLETNVNRIENADSKKERSASTLVDMDGILILMSIRNASNGTICEQEHYTRIKFYKDLDVPLGKFFQERLFNQSSTCSACSELTGAHFHYYAYHNKQLIVRVKQIPDAKSLPGERGGKLWMWSRCGKCYVNDGSSKPTYRVPVSAAAQDLSFGKFLEISFSQYLTSSTASRCGHLLSRDFFHFFGIGKMVAMFSISEVVIYAVARPPQMLVFKKSIKREKLVDETNKVHTKGLQFFREIKNHLQSMVTGLSGRCLHLSNSVKEFADVEKLLMDEKIEFEGKIEHLYDDGPYQSVQMFLKLNSLLWELLLESCIWERRIHDLLSIYHGTIDTKSTEQILLDEFEGGSKEQLAPGLRMKMSSPNDKISATDIPTEVNRSSEGGLAKESPSPEGTKNPGTPGSKMLNKDISLSHIESTCSAYPSSENHVEENAYLSGDLSVDRDIMIAPENESSGLIRVPKSESCDASDSSKQWIWTPFADLRQDLISNMQAGHLQIFEPINSGTLKRLPTIHQLITEEGAKLHIPLDKDIMLTCYEAELSSIIACALATLEEGYIPLDHVDEDCRKLKLIPQNDSLQNLHQMGSFTPSWSSTSSVRTARSGGSHYSSYSLDESRLSSFNGLDLLDTLRSHEEHHPEISLVADKFGGKSKYSVVCIYADRFRDLRNRCIPSEEDYISSLSRCRNWNAKGGKSKAFFAKTLDDRFIVKEIKRTEYDSFIKFALDYFKYMTESCDLRNPSCLAKIFGIYQVTVNQNKGVKEVKHDLLVMENLTFGRSIRKQYDLKGALHDRINSAADISGEVFLDQNFVKDMGSSPLYISKTEKHRLERAIWNDTVFLNSIQVMDYSLMVGLDAENKELVCGIIDYLRQYTFDKRMETLFKSSLLVPKNVMPTIIAPGEYKKRFRKFMSTYLLWIPDEWCSQEDSNSVGAVASQVKSEQQPEVEDLST